MLAALFVVPLPLALALPPAAESGSGTVRHTGAPGACSGAATFTLIADDALANAHVDAAGPCLFHPVNFAPGACTGSLAGAFRCSESSSGYAARLDVVALAGGGHALQVTAARATPAYEEMGRANVA